ncbi:MAG TPA: hypothetical protein VL992_03735 [Tepidisphaeraceae bacterium]|nr:hypothetical protein [Tepidisphaeraceae bacterium]
MAATIDSNLKSSGLNRSDALVLGCLLVGLLIVYSGVILIPYAFADDYPWLWWVVTHRPGIYARLAVQGRPLNALILRFFFRQAGHLGNLGLVRAASVWEISVMGWLFYRAVLRTGATVACAAMLGGLACVVPGMQVYAAWADAVPIPLAGIAAASAALLAGWALDAPRRRWPALATVPFLLGVSGAIYQPAMMVCVPIAAIDLFRRDPMLARRGAEYAALVAAGLFGAWCVLEYGLIKYPQWARPERSGITADFAGKLRDFASFPLLDSLDLYSLRPSIGLAIVVAVILFTGLLFYFRGHVLRRLACLAVAAAILPVCCLVTILARGDSWSYRTQIGLEWMMLALGWMALCGFRRFIRPAPVLAVATVICGVTAAYNVTMLIAWPQSVEQSLLRIALSQPDALEAQRIILLAPSWRDSPAPYGRYDEFGVPSLSEGWVPRAAVNLIRREIDRRVTPLDVKAYRDFTGPWTAPLPPGTVLIDMRILAQTRGP